MWTKSLVVCLMNVHASLQSTHPRDHRGFMWSRNVDLAFTSKKMDSAAAKWTLDLRLLIPRTAFVYTWMFQSLSLCACTNCLITSYPSEDSVDLSGLVQKLWGRPSGVWGSSARQRSAGRTVLRALVYLRTECLEQVIHKWVNTVKINPY